MTLYYAQGSPSETLCTETLQAALSETLKKLGPRERVLALPPDFTRFHSRAGELTTLLYGLLERRLTDVMPALGTHVAMSDEQLARMFPGLPKSLIREHRWREDVVTVGTVPADFVEAATEGIYRQSWPAQMNRLIWEGNHDLVVSIGQVVPHEVIGMANYNKNLFVGAGGAEGINESHFIGAAYGMERMMGRADTPLRRILNYAQETFCQDLPLLYVLTVIATDEQGQLVTRGLYIGDDVECFERASELSLQVNFNLLDQPLKNVVVFLDPDEFHSTWLGNKAIYRTRMAIADGGQLTVLAPGVKSFGEDPQIDALIRKYGYRTTPEIMKLMRDNDDLQQNLSAAAHLIHGSSEGRFQVTYCPGGLRRDEIEQVGYQFGELESQIARYSPKKLNDGLNRLEDGEELYFIRNPALGLWASANRFQP